MSRLTGLHVGDTAERWEALGFTVEQGRCDLGGVGVLLGGAGEGITAWAVEGIAKQIDGLRSAPAMVAGVTPAHPNGALGIDHVVVVTPDFDRTARVLEDSGLPLRRIREAGGFRQGFRRLGPAILELVEARGAPPGPASFWGLVVIVEDLDMLADRLADRLGRVKPAVQPGRHIATLGASAGLSTRVAFMDPEPATLA